MTTQGLSLKNIEKVYVRDLKDKDVVHSLFRVQDKNLSVGKTGKSFLTMDLCDKTGKIESRVWDRAEELDLIFESGDFVLIKGRVNNYQGRNQLVVHSLEKLSSQSVDYREFLETSSFDIDQMFSELLACVARIGEANLRRLVLETLQDPEIKTKFCSFPAAKSIHHAYLGGLLEHTLSVAKIMIGLSSHYSFLNLDLLLFGAVFHDLGKIWELSVEPEFKYNSAGRLVGHLVLCSEYIEKKSSQILGFPEELKDICKHIVLSHHGKLEYGSAKRPKLIEAMVVSMVDEMDSKIHTLFRFMTQQLSGTETWSRYHPDFDRYFLLTETRKRIEMLAKENKTEEP